MFERCRLNSCLPLIQVAEVMAKKYDVVVTNPPYMGSNGMNARLAEYVKSIPEHEADMSTVFQRRKTEKWRKKQAI